MRNLSSTFRHEMYFGSHDFDHQAVVTLSDDTVLTFTNTTLWTGGFTTDDAVSEDNTFTALGSTIIGAAKVIINNIDENYSDYDFTNAKVELSLSKTYELNDIDTVESISIGKYTVDDCTYNGGTITLSLLDDMAQFDRPYSVSNLSYPATLFQIVQDLCLRCGVTLGTLTFPHHNYVIATRPNDEALTCREVLGWAATIAGCFARCNSQGRLELKWFDTTTLDNLNTGLDGGVFDSARPYASGDTADGGSFNPWNTGYEYDAGEFSTRDNVHYISRLYSQTIGVDDIVITGLYITVEEADENDKLSDVLHTFGTDGYVIKIEKNKFFTKDNVNEIGTWLATTVVGMRFRNVNVTHINDPSIEAGDIALVIDRKQNEYPIIITRTSYSANGSQTTVCGAESPSRNSANRYSQATQAYVDARNLLNQEQSIREQAMASLISALNSKSGLYSTLEAAPGGGTIYYLHDKPLLEDSEIVWKMTADAWGVSTDGGETWNAGLTVDGTLIANILSAIGVDADWINTGTITVRNNNRTVFSANINTGVVFIDARNSDNQQVFYLDSSTGEIRIKATDFSLTSGQTLASVLSDAKDYADNKVNNYAPLNHMTQQEIFNKLTGGGSNQGIYLYNGKVYINWQYAVGGELKLGGKNNGYGTFGVYSYDGINDEEVKSAEWTNEGIKLYPGFAQTSSTSWSYYYPQIIGYIEDNNGDMQITGRLIFTGVSGSSDPGGIAELRGKRRARLGTDTTNNLFDVTDSGATLNTDLTIQGDLKLPALSGGSSSGYSLVLDTTDGQTVRYAASSSRRYKKIKRKINKDDISEVYEIEIYLAKYKEGYLNKGDQRENIFYPMFIAEQMQEHLPIAVDLNKDGNAETWNERVLIPIMFQMIKDQKAEIDELKERLTKIESLLNL